MYQENRQLRKDLVAMETAITERMGYLERHKVSGEEVGKVKGGSGDGCEGEREWVV